MNEAIEDDNKENDEKCEKVHFQSKFVMKSKPSMNSSVAMLRNKLNLMLSFKT